MKKRILSLMMCVSISAALIGCGKTETEESATPATVDTEDESYVYNIATCLQEGNDYNNELLAGFTDALTDYLGEEHLNITNYTCSETSPADAIATTVASKDYNLIFTVGDQMLVDVKDATETIPIVATGVVDFQSVLRIAQSGKDSWDKTTGINVTGVSSKPPIADEVSLMIEATPDLQTVGILYSPEDTEAIYQNEIFEKYLDQAGIPWKEYSIPASDTAITEEEDQTTEVLTPNKVVAYSAKSGVDNSVVSFGEDLITGINSPSSTRTALVSEYWTGGKVIESEESDDISDEALEGTDADTTDEESNTTDSDEESDAEDEVPTLEELITTVCNECSAIYIPYGSMLTDQMETIGSIATDAGVTTVAGDTTIGQNALVTLFSDPYALGYSAGKKAVKVFNGTDISTIKIGSCDSDDCSKLYNSEIAEKLGITFPKSFHEINDFLETYEYGSTITRYDASAEEE